jgi:N,N'-diacetylchitobiose phosphorylase
MKYGYFDDAKREYVVENPCTPMSWANYLGTSEYCGLISNNAAGYGFLKSAKTGRLMRFRFNSIPMDRPGRYVYIRDNADGDYWSASWQPVAKPLDQYKTVCRHGQGYTTFESEYKGIKSKYRVFVPIDRAVELWEVEVENTSNQPRDLSLFTYAEWCFWDMNQDLTNFQYILYTCQMGYADNAIDYNIRLWPFREPKGFMASVLPVESFDTDRDEFIGRYRHEGTAMAVEKGKCSGSIAVGGNPCGALQNRFTLAPGEKKWALFVVGVGDAKTVGQECRKFYSDRKNVDADFAKLAAYWDERLGKYSCKTPSAEVNSMVNIWNQYQCQTTFNWSRSASFNEAGGRDGMGFRDSNQDTLGIMHSIPELAKGKIVDLLRAQYSSGGAMHGVQPLTWKQGKHNIEAHVFSDDHLWILLSVTAYIKETADKKFLSQKVEFADKGAGTVYKHLAQALEFSQSKLGPHGLTLGLAADWNDCLNLRGQGESMFSTFLYYRGLCEMITLAKRLKRDKDVVHFEAYRDQLKKNIDQHAWDGEWFLRGYIDDGRKLGGKDSDQAKIFINSQTWAVLSGAADREKAISAMDRLHKYLATEHGVVKNFPAYRVHDAAVGAITCFPPGLKENAGIFCHANTWTVVAEGMLGRGDHAFKLYRSFLPAAKNDDADTYTMEPYVYSQFITGKEHPSKFGRARNSWLTGTASWGFVSISQYILGVRAEYDGLMVDPSIPSEWPEFEVTRSFRGATYHIVVKNPSHICHGVKKMLMNGKEVAGNVLPVAKPGKTVEVEITLEK